MGSISSRDALKEFTLLIFLTLVNSTPVSAHEPNPIAVCNDAVEHEDTLRNICNNPYETLCSDKNPLVRDFQKQALLGLNGGAYTLRKTSLSDTQKKILMSNRFSRAQSLLIEFLLKGGQDTMNAPDPYVQSASSILSKASLGFSNDAGTASANLSDDNEPSVTIFRNLLDRFDILGDAGSIFIFSHELAHRIDPYWMHYRGVIHSNIQDYAEFRVCSERLGEDANENPTSWEIWAELLATESLARHLKESSPNKNDIISALNQVAAVSCFIGPNTRFRTELLLSNKSLRRVVGCTSEMPIQLENPTLLSVGHQSACKKYLEIPQIGVKFSNVLGQIESILGNIK